MTWRPCMGFCEGLHHRGKRGSQRERGSQGFTEDFLRDSDPPQQITDRLPQSGLGALQHAMRPRI